jgi:hypothetical protein
MPKWAIYSEVCFMKRLLVVLMAAVLVAGCPGQPPQGATGSGLTMTSFTSDTDSQTSGRSIRMFLELENSGESTVDANNTLIYLNGPIGTGLLQWQIEGGRSVILERNLNPYDPLKDIPPGRASVRWKVTAPQMDPGQQKTDTFTARAYYDYETKAIGEVTAYSEAESVAARQRGEPLEKAQFSSTKGPLSISVRAVPDPVTITSGSETMTLEIVVENIGGGTLYQNGLIGKNTAEPNLAYENLNKVSMSVDAGNVTKAGTCDGVQELIGGKPTTLTCDVTVPMPATKSTYPIKVSLKYGYYVDSPLQLTAVGSK